MLVQYAHLNGKSTAVAIGVKSLKIGILQNINIH